MTLFIRVLWVVAALTGVASAQHAGDIPPALAWNKLKGPCPANLDWASLRGKVVVVSFSPGDVFPSDIDDWNEAARDFQGDQVQFIQVVGGSEFLLDRALQQTPYPGCVLFDADLRNHENFKLPPLFGRTVVVDRLGFIVGYARGGGDIEDAVRSVLENHPDTGLDETPPQPRPYDAAAGVDRASYGIHISLAQVGELRLLGAGGSDRYISRNQPPKPIVMDLWDTPPTRIAFPEKLTEENYDVTANMPGTDRELLRQLIREAVEREFELVVEKEERTERVYILTAQNRSPKLQPAIDGEKFMCGEGQGSIIGTAQAMQDIAGVFEGLLNTPVIDGTGLKGKYNYSVMSKLSESEGAFDMAHQLGLELTEAERPIEMLVVRKIQ
jgi:uncharacterized protein (TIGR03435 family)